MKRQYYLYPLFLVLVISLVGCSGQSNGDDNSKDPDVLEITLSTASTTGTYYPMGASFAKVFNENLSDIVNVSSQASDGSVQNLNLMDKGEVNAAFTSAGPLYSAYNGENEFEGRAFKDVRVVTALYPNASHVIAHKSSDIETVTDFKGKSFAVGAPGSVSQEISKWIFNSYDLTFDDLKTEFVDFSGAVDLMRNKRIDGIHYATAVGTSGIVEVMSTADGKLISLGEEQVKKITDEYPMYYQYAIPAGTYDGQEKDINTLAQNGIFVVSKDMENDMVYELTKALWKNINQVKSNISATKSMSMENAAKGIAGVPLHPGAEKYYKEQGIIE